MTTLRLPYLHAFVDRHGRPRYYFRHRGKRWRMPAPGSPGFMAEYEKHKAAIAGSPAARAAPVRFLPGALGFVIERFLASDEWDGLAAETRRSYRPVLDLLRQRYGAGLLRDLAPRHVKTIRNDVRKLRSTSVADIAVGLISTLWEFAVEDLEMDLDANPAAGVKRVHQVKDERQPWPPELIQAFERKNPHLRLALYLLMYTGQRRSEVIKMRWSQFDGESIEVRQDKTDEPLIVPCHQVLRAELERTARSSPFILLGERGRPYKAESLSMAVRRALKKMGVRGYSVHGLRKNAGVFMADAGCDVRDIMAVLGHRTAAMALHYTKRANPKRWARAAMDKWEAAAPSGKPRNVAGIRRWQPH